MRILHREKLDTTIQSALHAARIPGAAIAVVADSEVIFASGYGYRDLKAKSPVTTATVYPIASTTKSINATLLGMLVDEGKLAWDRPVQHYLPRFYLKDPLTSASVTVRDLITMRTGLPRHDWLWDGNPMSRAVLVDRLRHLGLSAGFRERYQYNNLTVTAAGHIAEIVTGQQWEDLVRRRMLKPLQMADTWFTRPGIDNVTLSYHENSSRTLVESVRLAGEVTAPSGGAIYSTVEDMARWILFNLNGGKVEGCSLIRTQTLREIHSPQIMVGADPSAPSPDAMYAMGWFVDTYNGCARLGHGGYIHDVHSDIMLFPRHRIGMVSFTNFGPPSMARVINQHVFDLLMDFPHAPTVQEKLALYEHKIVENRKRIMAVRRVEHTSPPHGLNEYIGTYTHAAYGQMAICADGESLALLRGGLTLSLVHWHYDAWVFAENDLFEIHKAHCFDPGSRIVFETNADGEVVRFSIELESAVALIRFEKQ